jgi:flagellar motor switch/type III secretory pathway protein FliN
MSNTSTKQRSEQTAPELDLEEFRSIGDICITVTAELGRRFISVEELLRFRVNDVFTLFRPTGEHVDLVAEGTLIGTAEIVATDETLSVQVTDLVDKAPNPPVEVPRNTGNISLPKADGFDET